jgi:DNA repair exonuclease SbcCD nuclease subunit
MWKKLDFIFDLADKYLVPIYLAGDLGQRSQWPNWLIEKFIDKINEHDHIHILMAFGQHDLPEHSIDLFPKSAVGVLFQSGYIEIEPEEKEPISIFHYGDKISKSDGSVVAISHQMVIEDKPEWPGQVADSAKSLLKKFPEYKLILCGDNHKPFTMEYEGRILVNPGSMMRTTADQIDHKPRVYLWDGEQVEPVYLPIEQDVISREHIDIGQHRNERITAYVDRLNTNYEIGLDFKKNMVDHFKANRTRKEIKERVWGAMEK